MAETKVLQGRTGIVEGRNQGMSCFCTSLSSYFVGTLDFIGTSR